MSGRLFGCAANSSHSQDHAGDILFVFCTIEEHDATRPSAKETMGPRSDLILDRSLLLQLKRLLRPRPQCAWCPCAALQSRLHPYRPPVSRTRSGMRISHAAIPWFEFYSIYYSPTRSTSNRSGSSRPAISAGVQEVLNRSTTPLQVEREFMRHRRPTRACFARGEANSAAAQIESWLRSRMRCTSRKSRSVGLVRS